MRAMVLLVLFPALAFGAVSATISWNPNGEPDLAGYTIYRGLIPCTNPGPLQFLHTVGTVTSTIDAAIPDTATDVCYELTAVDTSNNESLKSGRAGKALVGMPPPPPPPSGAVVITTPASDHLNAPAGPTWPVAATVPSGTTVQWSVDLLGDTRPEALIPSQYTSIITAGNFTDIQGGTFPAGCMTCQYELIARAADANGRIIGEARRPYTVGTAVPPQPPPPLVDTDGDGVPDGTDQCPTQAGPASTNGCPVMVPPPPPPVVDTVVVQTDTTKQVIVNIGACPPKATGATGVTTSRSGSGANRKITITCTTVP